MEKIKRRILDDGRNWFYSSYCDLYLWINENSEIIELQLTYDKDSQEKMIHWKTLKDGIKLSHCEVDDGQDNPSANLSPIIKPLCHPICANARERIISQPWDMEAKEKECVLEKIFLIPTA